MIDFPSVAGLSTGEQSTLNSLLKQWDDKKPRNALRAAYYDGKNAVRDLGISTPPNMRRLALVLGWSAKAVDTLNRRCNMDGFVVPGVDVGSLGLEEIWQDNRLDVEAPQVGVSSLIHAVAFLVTTQGDTEAGEPAVLITARDALSGAGIWDRRRRSLSSFLSVIDTDESGHPVEMVMYLPNLNITVSKGLGGWTSSRREHKYGVPVEPVVYQPRLGRPFGSSRISRAVMSLHDQALRTVLRSEVQAELFSAPQRVLLGADESAFRNADGTVKTAWQAVLGRIWAIPDDEGAANPRADVKQLTAASQEPHMAQLRAQAQLFAGETSIPISSLGISTDANPASAEAYVASREDLIAEAEGTTDGWSPAWRRTMLSALQMRDGLSEPPQGLAGLRPKWRNPIYTSRAVAADAGAKQLAAIPWLAETEIGLELLGLDPDQVERALGERRRMAGRQVLANLAAASGSGA